MCWAAEYQVLLLHGTYVKENVDTIVVDARSIGLGSTCASTSLLQYEIDVPLYELSSMIGVKDATRAYWLCQEAIDKLINTAREIDFNVIERKKSLYYAATKKDVPDLKTEYGARKKAGFDVQYLEGEDLVKQGGFPAPGAIFSAAAAQTDAYLFTHKLHQNALTLGLRVFDRTNVISIKHSRNGVKLHTDDGFMISGKRMVYATGYEAVNYISEPIVKLNSTYATVSEPISPGGSLPNPELLIWNTADPYLYMRFARRPDHRRGTR